VGGKWKIYDMIVENISLVENYRSQFDRILASATFANCSKNCRRRHPLREAKRGVATPAGSFFAFLFSLLESLIPLHPWSVRGRRRYARLLA